MYSKTLEIMHINPCSFSENCRRKFTIKNEHTTIVIEIIEANSVEVLLL
jgi:hypothetical protein